MSDLEKEDFTALYVTTWLATYAAVNYQKACDSGDHDALTSGDMVDEARTYASAAWHSYKMRMAVPCLCQMEAGDSDCPMHNE